MALAKVDFSDKEQRKAFRHTTSHVLAQAIKQTWPEAKLAIGPAIDDGFYYDIDLDHKVDDEDLKTLTKAMKKIIKQNLKLEYHERTREEAIEWAKSENEDYKVELQIAPYTRLFLRSYRQFKEQMQSFYEEDDLVGQLHWINGTFWLALGTGIASLALIFGNLLSDSIITLLFTAVFLIIGVFFINYQRFAPIVERAVMQEAEAGRSVGVGIKSQNDNRLREKIDAWIQAKGYLDSTKSVGDIAQEMGWYYQALKDYIQQTTGEDFRSWRLRLRIQEAQRLLAGQPALPISRIATLSGFNDRAHFYRCFQRITGCSPQEYRKSIQDSK